MALSFRSLTTLRRPASATVVRPAPGIHCTHDLSTYRALPGLAIMSSHPLHAGNVPAGGRQQLQVRAMVGHHAGHEHHRLRGSGPRSQSPFVPARQSCALSPNLSISNGETDLVLIMPGLATLCSAAGQHCPEVCAGQHPEQQGVGGSARPCMCSGLHKYFSGLCDELQLLPWAI